VEGMRRAARRPGLEVTLSSSVETRRIRTRSSSHATRCRPSDVRSRMMAPGIGYVRIAALPPIRRTVKTQIAELQEVRSDEADR